MQILTVICEKELGRPIENTEEVNNFIAEVMAKSPDLAACMAHGVLVRVELTADNKIKLSTKNKVSILKDTKGVVINVIQQKDEKKRI